ncbi:MFS general substrate transporter [Desarmillaria tabescens]|uniref:MFS general substrate transporter n=1 Tax=Armillaria tabescens TaxID=1929756 RepID=A0AA39TX60_ARMTA|nr:MFS general substrate transporter [Desarmillaria tabescens]KAK0462090.1 MFS general substrate transporter [Desarmillaria tabescens]
MSIQTENIELSRMNSEISLSQEDTLPRNESSLAPVDRGFDAWSFLVAAFFIERLVWGFPNAFGVFLDGYLSDPSFSSQPHTSSLLPLIRPLSSRIIYCSSPIIYPITAKYPYHRRMFMWVGATLCWASLLGASYTTKVSTLIGLQGVLYAVGGSLLYAPCISYMSEWFVTRRGLANSVIFAGTATGGLILPLILPELISRYGTAKTLRILSVALAALLLPTLPFVKPLIPDSRSRQQVPPPRSREWIKSASFWILLAANTFQGFGYFVPIVWLPTFAHAMNLSPTNPSLTVALLNGASVLGRLSMGYLSDKFNPWLLGMSTLFVTSLATFVLWGVLSQSLAGLLAFGIAYGILAGGWSSLWTGFVSPIASVGNILCTPISSVLETASGSAVGSASTGFQAADGRFENMILYVGSCFAGAASVALLGWGLNMNVIRSRRQRV